MNLLCKLFGHKDVIRFHDFIRDETGKPIGEAKGYIGCQRCDYTSDKFPPLIFKPVKQLKFSIGHGRFWIDVRIQIPL